MAVNKVEYGDTTLIDLTSDTVTKETLLIGATAHTASGESVSGEFDPEIYLKKSGGDTANNIVTFTSGDSTSPTAWTDVASLVTGEKHSSLLNKISTMIKNVRFLYKMLGTTDISDIGDGTITGVVRTLNSNFTGLIKYKDYTKTDTYIANEVSYVANLDDDGISGYIPFFAQKINMETDNSIQPIVTNYTRNYVGATYLVVHNLTSNSLSSRTDVIRVFFISSKVVK